MLITSIHHNEIPAEKFATFADACTSTETLSKTIVVSSEMAISSDITVEDRALRIANGGKLTVASTKTLTINAPFQAGLYQVFDGDGSVVFGSGSVTEVYPEWWGIDGVADEIQINQAIRSGCKVIRLSHRVYNVDAPISITSDYHHIKILGSTLGIRSTQPSGLRASAATIGSVINIGVVTTAYCEYLLLKDVTIDTNGCNYGIYGYFAQSLFENVYIRGAAISGIAQVGWVNRYIGCILSANANGLSVIGLGGYSGNLVINRCTVVGSIGWGIVCNAGGQTSITDCTIESNQGGGIYIWGQDAVSINNCYFEANASVGTYFNEREITVKTNILINGASLGDELSGVYLPIVNVTGCYDTSYTAGANATSLIFASGVNALTAYGNKTGSPLNVLVRTYGSSSIYAPYGRLRNASIYDNYGYSKNIDYVAFLATIMVSDPSVTVKGAANRNISPPLSSWVKVVDTGAGSAYGVSTSVFDLDRNTVVYDILDADSYGSDIYGFTVDASAYPIYWNKILSFSAYISASAPAVAVVPYCASVAGNAKDAGDSWALYSHIFKFPTSGTLYFGLRKTGTGGKALITCPVLCEYGSDVLTLSNR